MNFSVKINIKPQDALLDPQGKTVEKNMSKLGNENISNIRIGKHITMNVEAENITIAKHNIEEVCKKLLVNQITEQYTYVID
tara:strand:- start:150 stop:395 length:246 start_codon:yes stop_codon:yes gene_type:complete